MKTLFISTDTNSLTKLHAFSRQLDEINEPHFILVQMTGSITMDAIAKLRKENKLYGYDLVILADQDWDQEIAAGIAVSLETSCSTRCANVTVENDTMKIMREVFGGLAHLNLNVKKKPYVLTIATSYLNASPAEKDWADFETITAEKNEPSVELTASVKIEKSVDLTNAKKIVSVGRGIDKEENISIVEGLAKALDAEFGCSRPISEDFKWLPIERQVGLTGEIVKPDLYIAVGISGQVQHVVGMRDSKVVIAINNNKSAPIFEFCDYGLVGDLFEIVPAFIQKIADAE